MFKKGAEWNGNAGGRPKNLIGEIIRKKKGLPEKLVKTILQLLDSGEEKIRIQAAEFLRDSGWGKPAQAVELSGSLTMETPDEAAAREDRIKKYMGERLKP